MNDRKAKLGDVVHFVHGNLDAEVAAIVTDAPKDGDENKVVLTYFTRTYPVEQYSAKNVRYSEKREADTFHFPDLQDDASGFILDSKSTDPDLHAQTVTTTPVLNGQEVPSNG